MLILRAGVTRRCICFDELGNSESFTEKVRKETHTAQGQVVVRPEVVVVVDPRRPRR
jgi:hypothetical protein